VLQKYLFYTVSGKKRVYSISGITSSDAGRFSFPADWDCERFSEIGQDLMKLCLKYSRLFFSGHSVVSVWDQEVAVSVVKLVDLQTVRSMVFIASWSVQSWQWVTGQQIGTGLIGQYQWPIDPWLNQSNLLRSSYFCLQILRLKCTTFHFSWGSAPDPAGFKGLFLRREREGKRREKEGGEGMEGEGNRREEMWSFTTYFWVI